MLIYNVYLKQYCKLTFHGYLFSKIMYYFSYLILCSSVIYIYIYIYENLHLVWCLMFKSMFTLITFPCVIPKSTISASKSALLERKIIIVQKRFLENLPKYFLSKACNWVTDVDRMIELIQFTSIYNDKTG